MRTSARPRGRAIDIGDEDRTNEPECQHEAHAGTALLRASFADVITSMLDESPPRTVGELEEWGNPEIPLCRVAVGAAIAW